MMPKNREISGICLGSSDFVQLSGGAVIDESPHVVLVRDERADLNAGDRLPYVLFEIAERL